MNSSNIPKSNRNSIRKGRSAPKGIQAGRRFNPCGIFTGVFIPDWLVRARGISPGAKICYARLLRYAGQDGECHPWIRTLASEIGVSPRQAQNYLAELRDAKLVEVEERIDTSGKQHANRYWFLWHSSFELPLGDAVSDRQCTKDPSPGGLKDVSPPPTKDPAHIEEIHSEEMNLQESHSKADLDYGRANRKLRDSQAAKSSVADEPPTYPKLREALASYMALPHDTQREYPTDRIIVDVMHAAEKELPGATEADVLKCLNYLYKDRKLRPGKKHGPRSFAWFPTTVKDYFYAEAERLKVIDPERYCATGRREELDEKIFERMSGAF